MKKLELENYEEMFDEFLDDVFPEVELLGCKYNYSTVLKRTDEVAYRIALNDYIDSLDEIDEILDEMDEMDEEDDD